MSLLTLFLIISPFVICNSETLNTALDKPNIVFIMADDLGWGNVGFHNKENPEIKTPYIDYLARHGLQLDRHYVDAECSPTRTSFQSGRLPVHVNTNNNDGITDSTMGIPPDMTCIASKLKTVGYSTHMVGKWDAGFASFRQIPISRGYDTSFGYLGKSIEYFSKKGDGVCSQTYHDIWENDSPAKDNIDDIELNQYSEYVFAEKVLTKIDEMAEKIVEKKENSKGNGDDKYPFFIFYASHLPHYPSELPEDCIENGYYTDFKDDESQCSNGNSQIFPGYYEDTTQWKCRSILQAQVAVLDDIVGQITAKLKENNLWEDTLIIFTSDNGGSLELDQTAGNNYPLRGGKASFLEGGIRATAFVSGGYLPESRHGSVETGMMHISDWYVTFSEMLGVDPNDYNAKNMGLPDVDGYNMWPLIAGYTDESPRDELIMSKNVLFEGNYKIIIGSSTKYAIWQSPIFPNKTTPTQLELEETYLVCDSKKKWGCLFNVVDDPGEHIDLADDMPDKVSEMRNRLEELKAGFFESTFSGKLSCPDNFDVLQDYVTSDIFMDDSVDNACGCWMSVHNYGKFAGPYMNLRTDQIHYDEQVMNGMIQEIMIQKEKEKEKEKEERRSNIINIFDIGNLQDFKSNYVIYIALIVATTILLIVVMRNCKKSQKRKARKKKKIAMYGTV